MTEEQLRIIRAFIAEYERLCDQFIVTPEKHEAYNEVVQLVKEQS